MATCNAGEARRYDKFYGYDRELKAEEWTDNEKFLSKPPWEVFQYTSGDNYVYLLKTDSKAKIVARFPNVLILADPYEPLLAVGMWSYAVNLHIPDIVAVDINAHGNNGTERTLVDTGLKARIVALDCDFEFGPQ